jgi:transposase-like protein
MDETIIKQQSKELVLFAAVNPETRDLLHAAVAPSRNTLTTRRFLLELAGMDGQAPPIVVTDGDSLGPVFAPLGITYIDHPYSVRNCVERGIQELRCRICTFYASLTGNDVATTANWLKQSFGPGTFAEVRC